MLITPSKTIELVLSSTTKNTDFRFYDTELQKWLFKLSVGTLGTGVALALLLYVWKNEYIMGVAFYALLTSSILATVYQAASLMPELAKLRNVEREISNPLLTSFNSDVDLIHELSQVSALHHLNYAKVNFALMAKQLRERISILVGALEKVGVIPLAITGYFYYLKAQQDKLTTFGGIEWILVTFVVLYLLAIRMAATAQWMEKVSAIYEQAAAIKAQRES